MDSSLPLPQTCTVGSPNMSLCRNQRCRKPIDWTKGLKNINSTNLWWRHDDCLTSRLIVPGPIIQIPVYLTAYLCELNYEWILTRWSPSRRNHKTVIVMLRKRSPRFDHLLWGRSQSHFWKRSKGNAALVDSRPRLSCSVQQLKAPDEIVSPSRL